MVTFKLQEETDSRLVFYYYPEGNENNKPGIIVVDRTQDEIEITELAQEDWEYEISVEELNEMAEEINQMKRERGATDFLELATEPLHCTFYSDHALNEIIKYLRKGIIPKEGKRAWY